MNREDFSAIAQICVGQPLEKWFSSLSSLSPEESSIFDHDIQEINQFLFRSFSKTMPKIKRSTAGIKFHKLVYDKFTATKSAEDLMSLPQLQDQHAMPHLLMTLARWFWEMLLEVSQRSNPVQKTVLESPNKEVNCFVGWAIFSVLHQLFKTQEAEQQQGADETEVDEDIEFVKSMRIFHSEAVGLPGYMADCYDPLDMMMNLGGLTLVAPEFFKFGEILMEEVAEALSEDLIKSEGNKCMKKARATVKANKEISIIFLESSKNHPLEESRKLKLLDRIITKACNARFGAVFRLFKDHHTGRRGDKKSDTSLRAALKA
jgi:hypothetical protein